MILDGTEFTTRRFGRNWYHAFDKDGVFVAQGRTSKEAIDRAKAKYQQEAIKCS